MSERLNSNNKWARTQKAFHSQWGNQNQVVEVRDSDSSPQDGEGEWHNCYVHTQVGWYFINNIFVSSSQMFSYQKAIPTGKLLNPKLATVKLILCEGYETHQYYEIMVDINNTSFEELKNMIPVFAKEHFIKSINYEVLAMGGTDTITRESVETTNTQTYIEKEALGRKLWSASHKKPYEYYLSGKKFTENEKVINITDGPYDLLTWFHYWTNTIVVDMRRTGNEQIGGITWWEWVLGAVCK